MSEAAADISELMRVPDLVGVVVPTESLFSLLRRSWRIPADWLALIGGPEGERTVAIAGTEIIASSTREVAFFRAAAVPLTFTLQRLTSVDGYLCEVVVEQAVRLSDAPADLAAVRSILMRSSDRITRAHVEQYLLNDVRAGLVAWAGRHRAADLVDGRAVDDLSAAVKEATQASCFAVGIRLLDQKVVRCVSPAYEAVRVQAERAAVHRDRIEMDRQLAEAANAARREHLGQVEEMLDKLRKMAESSPGVSIAELIRTFGQDQRGPLYRSLVRSAEGARSCQSVVVATGNELLWFDPADPTKPRTRQPIQEPARGIRSLRWVQSAGGEPLLAVGGSDWVLLLARDGTPRRTLAWGRTGSGEVSGGVNSVACNGQRFMACHSQLGVVFWQPDLSEAARPLLSEMTRTAKAVRNALTDSQGRFWLSVDATVVCLNWPESGEPQPVKYVGSRAPIASMAVTPSGVFAGNEAGEIVVWETDRPDACTIVYSGGVGVCRSLHWVEVMGFRRLGLTDDSDAVKELVLGDTVLERYVAADKRRFRQAWWSDESVYAINDLRTQLSMWSIGQPDAPHTTVDIGWMCSNRIQDVCPIPEGRAEVSVVPGGAKRVEAASLEDGVSS